MKRQTTPPTPVTHFKVAVACTPPRSPPPAPPPEPRLVTPFFFVVRRFHPYHTHLENADDDGTDLGRNAAGAALEYGLGVEYEHVDAGERQEAEQPHDGDGRPHRGPGRYQVLEVAAPVLLLLQLLLQLLQLARDVVLVPAQQHQRLFRLLPLAAPQQVRGRLGRDQQHQHEHDHRYDAAQHRQPFVRDERPDGVHVQYAQRHLHLDVRAELTCGQNAKYTPCVRKAFPNIDAYNTPVCTLYIQRIVSICTPKIIGRTVQYLTDDVDTKRT